MFNEHGGRIARVLLAGAAAALMATGCAGGDQELTRAGEPGASARQQARFNDADVRFASQMIPHHRQAIEMADLTRGRAGDEVAALAKDIAAAQQPEIDTMSGWLRGWGKPVPRPDGSGMAGGHGAHDSGHSGHGGMSGMDGMAGMMSSVEMGELRAASGPAFDRMFLDMMIRHHDGAIEMASAEQRRGVSAEAKRLAGRIVVDQRAEIQRMRVMQS